MPKRYFLMSSPTRQEHKKRNQRAALALQANLPLKLCLPTATCLIDM